MKRLCALLSLVGLLGLSATPALARADDAAPPATELQASSTSIAYGWTWDEG